ncbi:MAG: XTP/dITP diphosphatase [Janthinobacterium lividum]
MRKLMLATNNAGKVIEFRALLGQWGSLRGVELVTSRDWPQPLPDVAETGTTFAENARLKAVALARATGLPALADDSGLCVDALDGQPGLYSARWAGLDATDADRNALLLSRLAGVEAEKRTARYVCVVSLATPNGHSIEAMGTCVGQILEAPRGTNGFGYDPLFLLPDMGRTMAELTASEKNQISHRALAISALSEHFDSSDFILPFE